MFLLFPPRAPLLRQAEQQENKAKSLAIENKRRQAKGLEPLSSLEESGKLSSLDESGEESEIEEAESPADKDEEEKDEPDPLLVETGYILVDSIPVYFQERFAVSRRK